MSDSASRGEVLSFLADIKEHPFDDGLRLILADWLEDYGGPLDRARADLIRAQIDFARLPAEDPRRNEAGRRARQLQLKHARDWLGPLARWPTAHAAQRGLWSLSLAVSSLHSQALRSLAPTETWAWVEEVYVTGAEDEDVTRLRHSPLFPGIVSLGFKAGQLGPAGLQALAGFGWAAGLSRLDLSHQPITGRGLSALRGGLPRLRQLDLAGTHLSANAGAALGALPCPELRELTLWGNALGDTGVAGLLSGEVAYRLRLLDLRGNGIGDEGVAELAGSECLAELRELNLADNRIGSAGARALSRAEGLPRLERLVLWGNPVGAEGVEALRDRFGSRVHVSPARAG